MCAVGSSFTGPISACLQSSFVLCTPLVLLVSVNSQNMLLWLRAASTQSSTSAQLWSLGRMPPRTPFHSLVGFQGKMGGTDTGRMHPKHESLETEAQPRDTEHATQSRVSSRMSHGTLCPVMQAHATSCAGQSLSQTKTQSFS